MPLTLLLAFQSVAAPPIPTDFDLGKFTPPTNCESQGPYDVVVCGPRRHVDRNRVYPIEGNFDDKPIVAATGVGRNTTAAIEAEDAKMGNGQISHRMMMRLKLKF